MSGGDHKFKFGNTAWQARSSHGRKPKFKTPDILRDACYEYLKWASENPLISIETVKHQGRGRTMAVPRMRATTTAGLCVFLDISLKTWHNYRDRDNDYLQVVREIELIMQTQKFEGAAADMLNANIIARDLGLTDRQEVNNNHKVDFESDYLKQLQESAGAAGVPDE